MKRLQSILATGDYPDCLLFEEHDGLYWLSDTDASRLKALTGGVYEGSRVGFDDLGVKAQIVRLLDRGVRVGVCRAGRIRILRRRSSPKPKLPGGTPIFLAAELLLDRRELEALRLSSTRKRCPFRAPLERWLSALSDSVAGAFRDNGAIYVYQVADAIYEVDWELTPLSELSFSALALAADQTGTKLPCRLVPPRSMRVRNGIRAQLPSSPNPAIYGQMPLLI